MADVELISISELFKRFWNQFRAEATMDSFAGVAFPLIVFYIAATRYVDMQNARLLEKIKNDNNTAKLKLLSIPTAMLGLPREIRDIIYTHILDPETLKKVHDVAFAPPTLADPQNRRPTMTPIWTWPFFLRPRAINKAIRIELVQRFCELNDNIFDSQLRPAAFFESKLFGTEIALHKCTLSCLSLQVTILHDPDSGANSVTNIWRELKALLPPQKLSKIFVLKLCIKLHGNSGLDIASSEFSALDTALDFFRLEMRILYPELLKTVDKLYTDFGIKTKIIVVFDQTQGPTEMQEIYNGMVE